MRYLNVVSCAYAQSELQLQFTNLLELKCLILRTPGKATKSMSASIIASLLLAACMQSYQADEPIYHYAAVPDGAYLQCGGLMAKDT